MSAVSIGALTAGVFGAAGRSLARFPARSGAQHRTGAPVLRNSREAGTFEDHFWAVPAGGEPDKLLRACRNGLDKGRHLRREARAGKRLSAAERLLTLLTAGAVRVFEELCTLSRLNKGRVFPSYEWLAEATGLGRGTVARALNILEKVGFIVRQRRFKRVDDADFGRRYEQTSNAYRPTMADRVLGLLPRWMRPPPPPADEVQREADRRDDCEHMLAQLTCREYAQATITDGPLQRQLARFGARIDSLDCGS
jgi:DNA-binding transcriptional ArsR family regulator